MQKPKLLLQLKMNAVKVKGTRAGASRPKPSSSTSATSNNSKVPPGKGKRREGGAQSKKEVENVDEVSLGVSREKVLCLLG